MASEEGNALRAKLAEIDERAKTTQTYTLKDGKETTTKTEARKQLEAGRKAVETRLRQVEKEWKKAHRQAEGNKPKQSGRTFSISQAVRNGLSETEARARAERARQAGLTVVE
jgi:hypothetical protein